MQLKQSNSMLAKMRESNDINRQSLDSVQRAFMYPNPSFQPIFIPNTTDLANIEITPMWSNGGTTPTRGLTIHTSWQYYATPDLPDDFVFPDMWEEGAPHVASPFFAGPKGGVGGEMLAIPKEMVELIEDKKIFLFVWGWAKYHDTFPDTPLHITKFCWRIDFVRKASSPQTVPKTEQATAQSRPCIHNNCADDECNAQK